jgi:hypothetical protein
LGFFVVKHYSGRRRWLSLGGLRVRSENTSKLKSLQYIMNSHLQDLLNGVEKEACLGVVMRQRKEMYDRGCKKLITWAGFQDIRKLTRER